MRMLCIFLVFVMGSNAALAQAWNANIVKDDFGEKDTGIAISVIEGRGFGFRCIKGEDPAVVFATREQWAPDLALLPALLLVRVDDQEAIKLAASLEPFDGGNAFREAQLVRAVSNDAQVAALVKKIETATAKISVAIQIGENRFEATRFAARGSTNALKKIMHLCEIN